MTKNQEVVNNLLSLRDVASWQFPALVTDSQGRRHPPQVLAGLPSLQRGAVWRPNQVELLWDSIMRGFPIGSLVVTPLLQRQKSSGVKSFAQVTLGLKPHMEQQVSSSRGHFAALLLRGLGAT